MIPLLVPLIALVGIAFFTLIERNSLGYIQTRNGPNNPGVAGLPQPLADAINLFTNETPTLGADNPSSSFYFPCLALLLALLLWAICPTPYSILNIPYSIIGFICISAINVYWVLGVGWASNGNYSLLGALRSVAQTISYEIPIIVILLIILIALNTLSINNLISYPGLLLLIISPLFLAWLSSCLAETNRTPFDHAEGESELVSGFNTEYSAGNFALLFIAEYTSILFLSLLTPIIFINTPYFPLMIFIIGATIYSIIWIRGSLPRIRYDSLMLYAWIIILPSVLILFIFYTPLVIIYWEL